jgi:hypothetical protein
MHASPRATLDPGTATPNPTEADTWDHPVSEKGKRRKGGRPAQHGPRSNMAQRHASRDELEAHAGLLGRASLHA